MRAFVYSALLGIVCSCGPEKSVNSGPSSGTYEPDLPMVEWIKGPETGEPGSNVVRLDFSTFLMQGQELTEPRAGIYMKIHGHGGLDEGIRMVPEEGKPGSWIISNFGFTMTGPWELNIEAQIDGMGKFWEIPVEV